MSWTTNPQPESSEPQLGWWKEPPQTQQQEPVTGWFWMPDRTASLTAEGTMAVDVAQVYTVGADMAGAGALTAQVSQI
ncbi:hypothetical protein, partial [Mycobacteroides chelonae]